PVPLFDSQPDEVQAAWLADADAVIRELGLTRVTRSQNPPIHRYVTDWTGPAGMLHEVKIRLGTPNYPGDLMTLTGAVTAIEDQGERGSLSVSLKGSNASGDHVVGTVLVSLPKEAK
ncbi:MAG: hypothetical protein NT160_01460, partial [Actinobacteria bacterium]|nr:hypothetical protein [Actinomycetota bacterium]